MSLIGTTRKALNLHDVFSKIRLFVCFGTIAVGLSRPLFPYGEEGEADKSVPEASPSFVPPSEPNNQASAISAGMPVSAPFIASPFIAPPFTDSHSQSNQPSSQVAGPELTGPYWIKECQLAIKAPIERTAAVDIESMIWAALAHSPHIRSIQTAPQIHETEIRQAQGNFDPTRFANSIWNDRSDPVGNTLTTGGRNRFNEQNLENKFGVRQKNDFGGSLEASQDLSLHDSNSVFFVPRKQADSKMILRYTQPLMRGYGTAYNRASITIAELNFQASSHEANQALQTHVMDLNAAFWNLVYQRSQTLQINRGIEKLTEIRQQLENRSDLDLIQNQLLRARSAISTLYAKRARALSQIVESEEKLRQLVNAPWIQPNLCDEIVPTTLPVTNLLPISIEEELATALNSRPDVLAIRDQIQAANVKLRVAEQDLRPTLNLVTDAYVRGLNGQYDIANSLGDQFSAGAPSYSGGFEYQRPKSQTLAKAIRRQRDLEIQQLLFDLENRLLIVSQEVRTAIAVVQASHAELESSAGATIANHAEVEYLEARWQNSAFLEPTQISLNLEQLLDAQQRLIQSEGTWAASQSEYMTALARLRFVVGTLLTADRLEP